MKRWLQSLPIPSLEDDGHPRSRTVKYYTRKTNRNYGAIFRLCRMALSTGRTVTPDDFTPVLTRIQAVNALWRLQKRGEAILVAHGRKIKGGSRPVRFRSP